MTGILPFAGGVVFGALVVLVVLLLRKKDSREIAGPWSARPRPRRSRTSTSWAASRAWPGLGHAGWSNREAAGAAAGAWRSCTEHQSLDGSASF